MLPAALLVCLFISLSADSSRVLFASYEFVLGHMLVAL